MKTWKQNNRRFAHKVMDSKVAGNQVLGISKLPRQNDIWVLAPWLGTYNTTKGRWWLPPSPGCGESCESLFVCGLFVHDRCSSYTLTDLLFGLCKYVWVIDLLINLPSFHLGAPTCPSTPEVLRARECTPTFSPFIVVTFGLAIESIKELGGASLSPNLFHVNNNHQKFMNILLMSHTDIAMCSSLNF
jgi:hypothetical protein